MEKELDLSIIKATQLSLGKYVKRPPLSDKLLKKPPFRFLHDIVTSVLKSTGFFEGLFEDHELKSDNVKDREAKITFLNKVIYVISRTVGKDLHVKPSKIVAGQEPEKTNELLQCLAEALDKKLTSKDAVRKSRETTDDKKNVSKGKEISKSKENTKIEKSGHTSNKRIKLKENNIKQKPDSSKNISQQILTDAKDVKGKKHKVLHDNIKENINEEVPRNDNNYNINPLKETLPLAGAIQNDNIDTISDKNSSNDGQENVDRECIEFPESDTSIYPKTNKEIESVEHGVNSTNYDPVNPEKIEVEKISDRSFNENSKTADYSDTKSQGEPEKFKNMEISNASIENYITSNRPSSVRPSSSRPGAPKVRDKQDYRTLPDAENIAIGKVNIISENVLLEEDEESTLVIENYTDDIKSHHAHDLDQHGHLVQQILDSQKEFTQVNKTEIDWTSGSQKTRDDFSREIEQIRFNVQALSRVANPLGKILDHIQEDVEVMRQELSQWLQIYNETTKKLLKQKALNEEIIAPLRVKSTQLEMDISEKYKKIDTMKIIVYKNNTKIDKLLANEHIK
ncbi:TRAF3-interacting protein 1 isoform X1 [Pieris napi]|uniref:TRAF3-interacting protein 1 isoform X1 n=1 Tax=Pieris napi TaxID=78633 RepID=UPI001FBB30B5|nr:TRAF3-interacting protein 1 isoform X1 [Pieris napi]